jgi:hypothetical protein
VKKFQRLLFDLILLNAGDFKENIKLKEIKTNQLDLFLFNYLCLLKCPILNQENIKQMKFLKDQRKLLIILGWFLSEFNLFDRMSHKIL